jgi:hypothetical protein
MQVHVPIEIQDIPQPGLGAWSITVRYDPAIVAATSCVEETGNGVCNAAFAADGARLTGATENAIVGNAVLGQISFRCLAAGSSQLILSNDVFTIAVIPPVAVTPELQNGTIACAEPTASSQPTADALPWTGSGSTTGSTPWLPVALLGAGALALAAGAIALAGAFGARGWRSR